MNYLDNMNVKVETVKTVSDGKMDKILANTNHIFNA